MKPGSNWNPLGGAPIAGELVFNRALVLERRRSERTRGRLGLAVIDFAAMDDAREAELAAIGATVRDAMRETDFTGWYRFPSAIGVILTTLDGVRRPDLESAMGWRLREILSRHLDASRVDQVRIAFHVFPEDDGGGRPGRPEGVFYPWEETQDRRNRASRALKRAMDLSVSLAGLVVLSPLLLLVAGLVRLSSPGPVLFRQKRIGQFGREFMCLKFRSMHIDNDPAIHQDFVRDFIERRTNGDSGAFKITNDPRVTPLGRWLRKTSLDELPQLINVLVGHMSLVGPRPPIPYELENYQLWHRRRILGAKPGITGEWQVRGRSRTTFDDMVRMDLDYIRNQSFWLDAKILLLTPLAVLSGDGAH